MSVVAATHDGSAPPRWIEWDGTTIIEPEHGFAWIDVVEARVRWGRCLDAPFNNHSLSKTGSRSIYS